MNDVKPFWASVTLWSAVAVFIGILLPGFGVNADPAAVTKFFSSFQQMLDSVLTFGGLAGVVYGRVTAKKQVALAK